MGKSDIFYINKGGGHCIHYPLHYDTDKRDYTGGSVLGMLVQAVDPIQGHMGISVCQY